MHPCRGVPRRTGGRSRSRPAPAGRDATLPAHRAPTDSRPQTGVAGPPKASETRARPRFGVRYPSNQSVSRTNAQACGAGTFPPKPGRAPIPPAPATPRPLTFRVRVREDHVSHHELLALLGLLLLRQIRVVLNCCEDRWEGRGEATAAGWKRRGGGRPWPPFTRRPARRSRAPRPRATPPPPLQSSPRMALTSSILATSAIRVPDRGLRAAGER